MKTVTLNGTCYKVVRVESIEEYCLGLGSKLQPESAGLCGLMITDPARILIRKSTPREEASTLFHEMMHAVDPKLVESRVCSLESCIFPALWRNGWRPFG